MTTTANRLQRDNVLRIASWLTRAELRHNPDAVLLTAAPLLAWAEDAPEVSDLRARVDALFQHQINVEASLSARKAFRERPPVPEFLDEAKKLYAFLAAGDMG